MNLLLVLVAAATPVNLHSEPQVMGWTKDGTSFVWTWVRTSYMTNPKNEEESFLAESVRVAVVLDVATKQQTEYLVSYKALRAKNDGFLKKEYANAPTKADLDAWRRDHPLVATTGFTGPRGESADVIVDESPRTQWTCSEGCKVTLSVKKGAAAASVDFEDGPGMFIPDHSVDVYWDPTGWQAAFVVSTAAAQTMRGMTSPSAELYLVDIPKTRVQLLAMGRLDDKAKELVTRLNELNCDVTRGEPKKDRNATVIYAAAGCEEDAKAIAKLIKGATVEPLTWKPDAELVIALGAPGAR